MKHSVFCVGLLLFLLVCSEAYSQRIISLCPSVTEILKDLRAEKDIVGYSAYASNIPGIIEKPVIGDMRNINVETIVSLKPTIVLGIEELNHSKHTDALVSLGLNVQLLPNPRNWDELKKQYLIIADMVHRRKLAERKLQKYEKHYASLKAKLENFPARKTCIILDPWQMITTGGESYLTQLLDLAQWNNVFACQNSDYMQISPENILVAQPELILDLSASPSNVSFFSLQQKPWFQRCVVAFHSQYIAIRDPSFSRPNVLSFLRALERVLNLRSRSLPQLTLT